MILPSSELRWAFPAVVVNLSWMLTKTCNGRQNDLMLAVKVKSHQSWFLSSSSTSFRRNYSINSTFIRCSRVLKSVKDLARCMKIQNHLFSFKTDQARLRMISFVSYWATHFLFPLLLSLSCFFFFFFLSLSFLLLSFFSQIIEYSRISEKSCSVGGCDALWRKRGRESACACVRVAEGYKTIIHV